MSSIHHAVLCCTESLSCVRLFATPWIAAHQAPLTVGILQAGILQWVAMPFSSIILTNQKFHQVKIYLLRSKVRVTEYCVYVCVHSCVHACCVRVHCPVRSIFSFHFYCGSLVCSLSGLSLTFDLHSTLE